MAAPEKAFSVTVSPKSPGAVPGRMLEPSVVWLAGEHDLSNAARLSAVLVETIALDHADVIIDLSGASFISGSTITVFMRTSAFLSARSRVLTLRAPTNSVTRLLGLFDLGHLIAPSPATGSVSQSPSEALRTGIDVPTEQREELRRRPAPPPVPARVDVPTAGELVVAVPDAEGRRPQEG